MTVHRKLFCFGLGYCAKRFSRRLDACGWQIAGSCRSADKFQALRNLGIESVLFDGKSEMTPKEALSGSTHVLISIPPDGDGDPVLNWHQDILADESSIEWVGYLSTIGVYGDRGGGSVDETSELRPSSERGRRRVAAERAWLDWGEASGKAVQVFRLAGVYGPGRSVLDKVRNGTAKSIITPYRLFHRIHVEDVATVLEASTRIPEPGGIYNVCDNQPATQANVVAYASGLCGVEMPPNVTLDEADLSPMARSFWNDDRRVRSDRIREKLGVMLTYPDYREGLLSIAGM